MKKLISKIGNIHSRVFGYMSKKAKNNKIWAIALTVLVLYEIVEHIVYPILVPYLVYMQFYNN